MTTLSLWKLRDHPVRSGTKITTGRVRGGLVTSLDDKQGVYKGKYKGKGIQVYTLGLQRQPTKSVLSIVPVESGSHPFPDVNDPLRIVHHPW